MNVTRGIDESFFVGGRLLCNNDHVFDFIYFNFLNWNYSMKDEKEMIQTFLPGGGKGEYVLKTKYERWSRYILSALDTDENFTLNDILERASNGVSVSLQNEVAWNILQVKRDLEARGFIKSVADADIKHRYYLKLTRQGQSKLNYKGQVTEWLKDDKKRG